MRDYIIPLAIVIAGIAMFFASELLPFISRRIAYPMLGIMLIGLAMYLWLR
jgi:hypothetical protein